MPFLLACRGLRVQQYGFGIGVLCPAVTSFPAVSDLLELVWPYTTFNFENVERFKNLVFQFAVTKGTNKTVGTVLRGSYELQSKKIPTQLMQRSLQDRHLHRYL